MMINYNNYFIFLDSNNNIPRKTNNSLPNIFNNSNSTNILNGIDNNTNN